MKKSKHLHELEIVARYILKTGRGITSQIVHQHLPSDVRPEYEGSTSLSLCQLSQDRKETKKMKVSLLKRERKGENGSFIYELADNLTLQDIINEKLLRNLQLFESLDFTDTQIHEVKEDVETNKGTQSNENNQDPRLDDNYPENAHQSATTTEQTAQFAIKEETEYDKEGEDIQQIVDLNPIDNNYLTQEIANLTKVVARLIQEIQLLKGENETLKADNDELKREFQQKLSALESKLNQPRSGISVEVMLEELLLSKVSTNGKNGVTH